MELFSLVPLKGMPGFSEVVLNVGVSVGFVSPKLNLDGFPVGYMAYESSEMGLVAEGASAMEAANKFMAGLLWRDAKAGVMEQAAKAKAENDAFVAGRSAPVVYDGRDFAMAA